MGSSARVRPCELHVCPGVRLLCSWIPSQALPCHVPQLYCCCMQPVSDWSYPEDAARFKWALLLGFGVLVCMCSLEADEVSTLKLMLDL